MSSGTPTNSVAPFKNIDLEVLRSISCLLVVMNHLPMLFSWEPFYLGWYFQGYGGVDVFFAISGYIITVGLLGSIKKKQRIPIILKSFWTKRVFRILPLAYLWTIIPIILSLTFNSTGGFGNPLNLVRDGIANVTQTANFHWSECFKPENKSLCGYGSSGQTPLAQYWSLSAEEQFYLIFPLLLLLVRRRWLLILLASIPIILIFFDRKLDLFILRFDAIAVGVLIAFAQTQKWYKEYYPKFLEGNGAGTVLLLFLILILGSAPAFLLVPFTQTIIVIIAAVLVYIASFNGNLFTRSIPWVRPFFLWLGDRSYAIYLIHVPAFVLATEIYFRIVGGFGNHANFYVPLLAAFLLFVLVEISAFLVERPLRRFGRKLAKEIELTKKGRHPKRPVEPALETA